MRYSLVSSHVLSLLIICCKLCDAKSHYDILGVPRTASSTVITKKYRELAKKFHPDKNKKDPNAQDKFIELSKAYEILNDQNSRRDYDHELKYGGQTNSNGRQSNEMNHHFNQRGGDNFFNSNDEEVFIFRTPDGRVFTRSARQQVHIYNEKSSSIILFSCLLLFLISTLLSIHHHFIWNFFSNVFLSVLFFYFL